MTSRFTADLKKFQAILNQSKNIVALTGAGISAESGIPVFRGPGGWWKTYKAQQLATPEAFRENPELVWEFYNYRRETAFQAHPNNAHIALAKLQKHLKLLGRNLSIITQNIDGLHTRAGSEDVVELHGSLYKTKCTKCHKIEEHPYNAELEKNLPKCFHCCKLVRPYIVWFGESLDEEVLNKAYYLMDTCDLCLVIGTSSVVYPAAMFAPEAMRRGVPVADFNLNDEPAHDDFAFKFIGPCGTTLPKALGVDKI